MAILCGAAKNSLRGTGKHTGSNRPLPRHFRFAYNAEWGEHTRSNFLFLVISGSLTTQSEVSIGVSNRPVPRHFRLSDNAERGKHTGSNRPVPRHFRFTDNTEWGKHTGSNLSRSSSFPVPWQCRVRYAYRKKFVPFLVISGSLTMQGEISIPEIIVPFLVISGSLTTQSEVSMPEVPVLS
jgi:hypothetical protein